MNNILLFLLTGCPSHQPLAASGEVSVDTLPLRSMSVQQAGTEIWRPELRPAWRDPTDAETNAITVLVGELLQAARSHTIEPSASALAISAGMRLERWEIAGSEHLVLTEQPDQRRGAGAYLFSMAHPVNSSPWLLWEAPHPYYDQRTGDIAAALYFNPPPGNSPAAFFTSSLHRYTQPDGKRTKRSNNPADPCHNAAHLFNIATQAAAQTFAHSTILQIHGFSASDDDNRPPPETLAVISAGRKEGPTSLSRAAADKMVSLFGPMVLLYPTQVQALGATTNVEMQGLQNVPESRFLHIEMSNPFRELLFQDPSQRDAFGAALFALATDPQIPL